MVITDFTRSLTGKLHRGVEKPPEGKSPPKSTTIPLVLGILTQEVYSREYRMLSGIKAGLLKVRMFRPFPAEEIIIKQ